MVAVCRRPESAALGLPAGRLGFEIQVETPQLILGADGRAPVAAAIHAGDGRVTSLHYGTYDYSASLQIAAEYQRPTTRPPTMPSRSCSSPRPVRGCISPTGRPTSCRSATPDQVRSAWRLHAGLVRRALQRGFYQGWDMHPGAAADPLPRELRVLPARVPSGRPPAGGLRRQHRVGNPRRAGHRPRPGPLPVSRLTPAAPSRSPSWSPAPTSTPTSSRRWPAPIPTPRPVRPLTIHIMTTGVHR